MTHAAYEASTSSGAPVECYEFIQGLSKWYFTTGTQEFTSLARTFIPSPVKRDRIKQGEDALKETLTLTFPRGDEFAAQFLGFAPDLVTTLNVYRLHLTDPDRNLPSIGKGGWSAPRRAITLCRWSASLYLRLSNAQGFAPNLS